MRASSSSKSSKAIRDGARLLAVIHLRGGLRRKQSASEIPLITLTLFFHVLRVETVYGCCVWRLSVKTVCGDSVWRRAWRLCVETWCEDFVWRLRVETSRGECADSVGSIGNQPRSRGPFPAGVRGRCSPNFVLPSPLQN